MNKTFYPRLAAMNIRKNARTYIPYILTCVGTLMLYYIIHTLSVSRSINEQVLSILTFGRYVFALFAVIFIFYTNSFLIKRRKKEFGLFNILGMEKKHLGHIVFFETLYTALISFVGGIGGGILFSKLMQLLLYRLLHFEVSIGIEISTEAILVSLIMFSAIFLLTYLNTLRQIRFAKPAELLSGSNVGEKEPKAKWFIALLGVIFLGAGYYIALTVKSPISAFLFFFIAVILVILGTYCLFTAGSIALLKLLRKNKKYYYKTRHFISISGMMYRMKQNAVGLANICILSTMVLVMLSTTVAMYVGLEDALNQRYNFDINMDGDTVSSEYAEKLEASVTSEIKKLGLSQTDAASYRYAFLNLSRHGSEFTVREESLTSLSFIIAIPLSDYNRLENKQETLESNEVIVCPIQGEALTDSIQILGRDFKIKGRTEIINADGSYKALTVDSYYMVFSDDSTILSMSLPDVRDIGTANMGENIDQLSLYMGFNVDADADTKIALGNAVRDRVKELHVPGGVIVDIRELNRSDFYAIYGGLLFLGIFLGLLFIMATVLIIYYKQVSEGYEDRSRFSIMQKVGMSRSEIKKSIHSQILTVFFLPLVTAGVHIAFAFPMITKLLAVLNLTNIPLFAISTVGVILLFGIFYAIVYSMTAKIYYKIVSA